MRVTVTKKNVFVSRLLDWHKSQQVIFPWRQTKDPYKILVSELLLRKTTRKQVKDIFSKFFEKYPTIESLSMAPVEEIQHIITPLGMECKRAVLLNQLA